MYHINTEKTRRKFLSALGTAGGGLVALRTATSEAFGEQPDGKPIVWRYDKYGNPETIRYIPKERHRRIKVYEALSLDRIGGPTELVNGITLDQRSDDPTDLALTLYVDRNTPKVRRKLPSRIKDVPVEIKQRDFDPTPTVCDPRALNFYDPLPANPEISGEMSDGTNANGAGTLGIVCWNDNPDAPYKCYITASHVVEDGSDVAYYLRHEGKWDDEDNYRDERVGSYVDNSSTGSYGLDVAKYQHRSGTADPDPLGNAEDNIGYLAGYWSHAGLTDRTTGTKSLPIEFAGKSTCYATTECVDTETNSFVEYQADISPVVTEGGDSGGPYVDSDSYLVALQSSQGETEAHGPTAKELLDRMNAQLSNPKFTG